MIFPSQAVVLTHVLSNPRIQPGRPMLWSVQGGSIILVLPESGYSVVKVEGLWILPLTYNGERKTHFPKFLTKKFSWRRKMFGMKRDICKRCFFEMMFNKCVRDSDFSMCYSENVVKCSQNPKNGKKRALQFGSKLKGNTMHFLPIWKSVVSV